MKINTKHIIKIILNKYKLTEEFMYKKFEKNYRLLKYY